MKRLVWLIVVLLVASFALAIIGMTAPILLIINIGFGWIFYVARVVPEVRLAWPAVITGLICLAAVLALGHWLARWLWREGAAGSAAAPWRMRWTVGGLILVLLLFASGIAATGVVHQVGWLASSADPMFTRRFTAAMRIQCGSNMRQLGYLIKGYADDNNGLLPDRLEGLSAVEDSDYLPELLQCPEGDHGYVYHGRGLSMPLDDRTPILTEPLIHHREGVNILSGDGSVRFVTADEVEAVFAAAPRRPAEQ